MKFKKYITEGKKTSLSNLAVKLDNIKMKDNKITDYLNKEIGIKKIDLDKVELSNGKFTATLKVDKFTIGDIMKKFKIDKDKALDYKLTLQDKVQKLGGIYHSDLGTLYIAE